MCASASRSFAGSNVMSAVRSVSAKRADLDCSSDAALSTAGGGVAGGVVGACARHAARVAINDAEPTAMITLFITSCSPGGPVAWWPGGPVAWWPGGLVARWPGGLLMHPRRSVQHRRLGAHASNRRFPHRISRGLENQVELHRRHQPRALRELDIELPGAPSGIANDHAGAGIRIRFERAADDRRRCGQVDTRQHL